jgi:glucose/arabinose dehydrogenase
MADNTERRQDPLFEFIVVGALVLGAVFAFGTNTTVTANEPAVAKPTPEIVKPSYVVPTGKTQTLVTGLRAPWELLFLPDGQALFDQRDSGVISIITKDLEVKKIAFTRTTPPCEKFCEGGTLGMTIASNRPENKLSLFLFLTTDQDNRVLKYDLDPTEDGSWSLSNKRVLIKGIERSGKSTTHNGGRLAIGPDGKLWISLGDSGMRATTSQNWNRLAGSVLRLNLDGSVPEDNPRKGSFVWAKGLRDTQGMAWDNFGNMWTTEFGEDTWDELNLIQKGNNYGWPIAEGLYKFEETPKPPGNHDVNVQGTAEHPAPLPTLPVTYSDKELMNNPRYTPPVLTWHPEEAACSGITFVKGSLISACLRGGKLWVIPVLGDKKLGEPQAFFSGTFGRLRKATLAPDGSLWLLTSNKDGRGGWSKGGENPKDDRIIRVPLKTIYY